MVSPTSPGKKDSKGKPTNRLSLYGMKPEDAIRKVMKAPPLKKANAAKKPQATPTEKVQKKKG